ncbi:MAG: DUF3067 family protein [Pseudanabaenaceae cyanobacterium SKYGB_i_bin29]|nr:DUF3067 family protein [Pseudanabaenaceae cyanobacterium SKYG29]MDW8420771.1 DUF3067 family protein [Pseudanabaenaceae cyanobacterium SKYGB_i_bin29]
MTGAELRSILVAKWGYSYDVQLRQTGNRIYLQVMWRYLEQASFPLSEGEYLAHLDRVAAYLSDWQVTEQVIAAIRDSRIKPRLGKAVAIPLQLPQGRAVEWLMNG